MNFNVKDHHFTRNIFSAYKTRDGSLMINLMLPDCAISTEIMAISKDEFKRITEFYFGKDFVFDTWDS